MMQILCRRWEWSKGKVHAPVTRYGGLQQSVDGNQPFVCIHGTSEGTIIPVEKGAWLGSVLNGLLMLRWV